MKRLILLALISFSIGSGAQDIVQQAEYWFDGNFDARTSLPIPPTSKLTVSENIDVSMLDMGLHTIHFRFENDSMLWSSASSSFFVKKSEGEVNTIPKDIISAEYWFDGDFENRIQKTLTASSSNNILEDVDVSPLNLGLHTIHYRFKDEKGLWSSASSSFFVKQTAGAVSTIAQKVIAAEYWFDGDFESRAQKALSADSTINIIENVDVSALKLGLHTIHYRFMAENKLWSSASSSFFVKQTAEAANTITQNIVAAEYWFDGIFDNRTQKALTADSLIKFTENIDISALNLGLHTIHYRFKDGNELWSSATSSFFVKQVNDNVGTIKRNIVSTEYWFDGDFENRIELALIADSSIHFMKNIDIAQLKQGLHTIHYRFKDESNLWSSATSSFFINQDGTQIEHPNNKIIAYRYWFNTDTIMHEVKLDSAARIAMIDESLPMYTYPKGDYILYMQFRDSIGYWSSTISDSITKQAFPIADFNFAIDEDCDSSIVTFTNNSIDFDSVAWSFGNGWSSSDSLFTMSKYVPGEYEVSLHIVDTASQRDSTTRQMIQIDELKSTVSIEAKACYTYSSPSGKVWTQSGEYSDTLLNHNNCDSIISITLTIDTVDTRISIEGDSLITLSDEGDVQWYNCDTKEIVTGETKHIFEASENGHYAAIISQNGCIDTSSCFAVTITSLAAHQLNEKLFYYPNPTEGHITIELGQHYNTIKLKQYDISGKIISQKDYADRDEILFELNGKAGFYIIEIITDNGGRALFNVLKE